MIDTYICSNQWCSCDVIAANTNHGLEQNEVVNLLQNLYLLDLPLWLMAAFMLWCSMDKETHAVHASLLAYIQFFRGPIIFCN